MRHAPVALKDLLDSAEFAFADLYTITLNAGGVVLRLTSADIAIAYEGETWTPAMITGGRLRVVRGLEVDTGSFIWIPDRALSVNGVPAQQAILRGLFDRARIDRHRAFFSRWGEPVVGAIPLFQGLVSDIQINGPSVSLSVDSLLSLLNTEVPGEIYQASCRHLFGGVACGVDPTAWGVQGSAADGCSASTVTWGDTAPNGAYDGWRIMVTTGRNEGVSRTVKGSTVGVLSLSGPLPFAPAVGDAFTLTPGCDKTLTDDGAATGCGRYGNRARFGGMPWVPVPEAGT